MSESTAWWKRYPVRGAGWIPYPPGPDDHPDSRLGVGSKTRLRGKPELVRTVIAVEWHRIRREHSYIVETSAPGRFKPYWFASQLQEAEERCSP